MTHPPTSLLGGLTPERFLAEYWQKRPLLVRQAIPGFIGPLSPEELAGLALEPDVESRLVSERRGRFALEHGPIPAERFESMPAKRWTVLVQAVDQLVPEVAELRDRFRFVPGWRIDDVMISYAAPEGGVGPHYDNYDVFLLQGLGRRRWLVGDACGPDAPLVPHPSMRLLMGFEPREDWVLEPGDMLYLPPRVAHNGIALERCMTYSIGFRAPGVADLVMGFAEHVAQRLDDGDRYADPDLRPPTHPGEIDAAALERVRERLAAALEVPGAIAGFFGRLVTEPRDEERVQPRRRKLGVDDLAQRARAGKGLVRNPGSRLAFVQEGAVTRLFADGEEYRAEGAAAELARRIADVHELAPLALEAALADPASARLLLALVNAGSLRPA